MRCCANNIYWFSAWREWKIFIRASFLVHTPFRAVDLCAFSAVKYPRSALIVFCGVLFFAKFPATVLCEIMCLTFRGISQYINLPQLRLSGARPYCLTTPVGAVNRRFPPGKTSWLIPYCLRSLRSVRSKIVYT